MLKTIMEYTKVLATFLAFIFGVMIMFMANGWSDAIIGIVLILIGFAAVKKF